MTWPRLSLTGAVVTAALLTAPLGPSAAAAVSAWLDAYAAAPSSAVADREPVASLTAALKRDGLTWIAANGASEANRRRLIAATFALDVAGARRLAETREVPGLVEWGCEQIRKRLPSPEERQWHVAALALLEGLGDPAAVDTHLAHAAARAGADPRVAFARAWLADARTPTVHPRQPLDARIDYPDALAATWQALAATPALAGEARLRVGFYQLLAGRHAEAKATLAGVGGDADTTALAALFTAWADLRDGRPGADPVPALRRALAAAPHSRTAAVWLAETLALRGDAAGAERIAEASLGVDAGAPDPWRTFYHGDYRRWPALVQALRAAVR